MKIAVVGVYYASNLGDAVICQCVSYWLRQEFANAQIDVIDIEGKTEFAEQETVSMRILKRRSKKLKREYWLTKKGIKDFVYQWNVLDVSQRQAFYDEIAARKYDVVVFAGGQLFMDWLAVDICEFLKRFERYGTPVMFNACGVGLTVSEKIRVLLSEYLIKENVKLISSRDDVVKIKRCYLGERKEAISTYDPALWVKEVYKEEKRESGYIGLGVMFCENENMNKMTNFWIKLIHLLEGKKIKWKMFCNGSLDDYNYGCYVLKKLNLPYASYICNYARVPEGLVHQIAGFSAIISFRLHSHIIAAALDIPAVALIWDEKVRFFYSHLGYKERCKTICDSADVVLTALQIAKEEGYNRTIIEEQKKYARSLLIGAINKELSYE